MTPTLLSIQAHNTTMGTYASCAFELVGEIDRSKTAIPASKN